MRYLKVAWHHELADEPVLLYSELSDDSYEVRKVEVFRDGSMSYADETGATGNTWLGEKPVPPDSEIAADPEFNPETITREEFERVWAEAHRS